MRFRRETGDFSIKLTPNEETHKFNDVQLPKGLSGEDLLGAVITSSIAEDDDIAYTMYYGITEIKDYGFAVAVRFASFSGMLFYDPKTGILGVTAPTPSEPEEEEEEEVMTFRSEGQDSDGNPMYRADQTYTLPNFHNGDPVKIYSADGSGLLYSGTISRIGEISNDTVVSGTVGQSVTVPAGTLKLTITYDANGEEVTDNNIYWNSSTGRVGHAFVVLRSSSTGGGGSQTK